MKHKCQSAEVHLIVEHTSVNKMCLNPDELEGYFVVLFIYFFNYKIKSCIVYRQHLRPWRQRLINKSNSAHRKNLIESEILL